MARIAKHMVTFNDMKYMVANEGFTQSQTIPASDECMTRGDIDTYVSNINTNHAQYNTYATNQLVPYDQLNPIVATFAWRPIDPYCITDSGIDWIAVGSGAGTNLITSSDGVTWSNQSIGDGSAIRKIRRLNNLWFAVFISGAIYNSSDGTNWSLISGYQLSSVTDIGFDGTLYMVVGLGSTHRIATSTNLTSWTGRGIISASDFVPACIAYYGTKWYIGNAPDLGTWGAVVTSTNASTFIVNTSDGLREGQDFTYDGKSVYVAGAKNTEFYVAVDGAGDVFVGKAITGSVDFLRAMEYFANTYFVGGGGTNKIITSPDSNVWTVQNSGGIGTVRGFAKSSTKIIAVGDKSGSVNMVSSTNGSSWTSVSNSLTNINSIAKK